MMNNIEWLLPVLAGGLIGFLSAWLLQRRELATTLRHAKADRLTVRFSAMMAAGYMMRQYSAPDQSGRIPMLSNHQELVNLGDVAATSLHLELEDNELANIYFSLQQIFQDYRLRSQLADTPKGELIALREDIGSLCFQLDRHCADTLRQIRATYPKRKLAQRLWKIVRFSTSSPPEIRL